MRRRRARLRGSLGHACGHDIHIASVVGAARAMSAMKDQWKGTLIFIGQPAEEVGKGASAMLKDGLFKRFPRPDFVLAQHVDSELEVGKVGYVSGFAFANMDAVDVTIRGTGGDWDSGTRAQHRTPLVV